jgi:hypothetical protein
MGCHAYFFMPGGICGGFMGMSGALWPAGIPEPEPVGIFVSDGAFMWSGTAMARSS